jgi:hypothetical protein
MTKPNKTIKKLSLYRIESDRDVRTRLILRTRVRRTESI